LNTERDRDEFYMGPWSNRYDKLMFRIWMLFHGYGWSGYHKGYLDLFRIRYFDSDKSAAKAVHGSGKLAYLFELIVFLVGLAAFGKIVLHLY